MNSVSHSIEEHLPLLLPYFSEITTLEQDAAIIGGFLQTLLGVDAVALARLGEESSEEVGWSASGDLGAHMARQLRAHPNQLMALCDDQGVAQGEELRQVLELEEGGSALLYLIYYGQKPCGMLAVCRTGTDWPREDRMLLTTLRGLMGAAFAMRSSIENEARSSFVLNTVMDRMKASIYITEVDTDRILFMNQAMKKDFGLDHPEGKVCWQLLQRGMKRRCAFCPVQRLLQAGGESPVIQWDEVNTVTGRSYHNYDSLIHWMDGTLVHLQQSVDVTELKAANTDELTQLLTRRPGKTALQSTLEQAVSEGRVVTVCFYDVNRLKEVNDRYGHAEGDRLITTIAQAVQDVLEHGEYAFRLSGDEFVVVFLTGRKNAHQRLSRIQQELRTWDSRYEMGFCYGLVEVMPDQTAGAEEVLVLADGRMYEQKRRYHIRYNEALDRAGAGSRRAESFVYDKDLLYDALVESTDDYPFICNMKTGVFRYAPAMVEEFGLPGEVMENAAAVWGERVHERDRAAFLESNQDIIDGRVTSHCVEYRALNRRGDWVWVRCRGQVELDEQGTPALFAGYITNLGRKNHNDHLTGLFNKLEFQEQIARAIEREPGGRFGIMVLGMDDLKHINDLYDRTFGDEVIRITSQRLQSLLSADAQVFRLDGDEFGILLRDGGVDELQRLYRVVNYSFENQQEYDGKKYYCTLSGGCAAYPGDAKDYLGLVKCAGYALEYAKKHGKKCCVTYSSGILDHRTRALEMVAALRESVENEFAGFSLRFQPLVEATTGRLVGAEALARWQCERFGQVSPMEFIPLLEQSGMILPVGKWVLSAAVEQCRPWVERFPNFVLNVNLSYLQLRGDDFPPFLWETLEQWDFPAKHLALELTETHFAQENRHVRDVFAELRRGGVTIAMDDFGTGYSTLGILKEIPADVVKIDKTFIRDIRTSHFDATFIRFVVTLCHDVNIRVCLEGVETEEEYNIVRTMDLDMIQGFYFGHPLTAEDFWARFAETDLVETE